MTSHRVATGEAQLVRDPERQRAWTLLVDGTPQSYVDLDDPTYLGFEYVRRIGHVVDLVAPPGAPVRAVHLGGGALTLARYIGATRPGSRQRVFEIDAPLTEVVRRFLPLDRGFRVRVRTIDGRAGLVALPDSGSDLVVVDVFSSSQMPAHLAGREFAEEGRRVLAAAGIFVVNVGDGPPLRFARSYAATLRAVFSQVCLIAEPGVLRGRRFDNLVLVAANTSLPIERYVRRTAGDPAPARVVYGSDLDRFCAGASVMTDADAVASPAPPEGVLRR